MKTKRIDCVAMAKFVTSPELAEVKVSYRKRLADKIKISCSQDAYDLFYQIFDQDTIEFLEQAYLILLNRANFVLGWTKISHGGISGTVIDPKVIFSIALLTGSSAVILSHNHPSGKVMPSEADTTLTKSLQQAGKFLEISLIDHLIIGSEGQYYSFADEGTL